MRYVFRYVLALLVLAVPLATAQESHEFEAAKAIIDAQVPCEQLSDDQLELLGDYFMEQMHPGEAHEGMDARMGGEGSESLRLMHISMGRSFYCGESMPGGMMGSGFGMMGGGVAAMGRTTTLGASVYLLALLVIAYVVWSYARRKHGKTKP